MRVGYELWDHDTGNCIGACDDEAAALAAVRADVARLGRASYATVALLRREGEETALVAAGEELIDRALAGEGA